MKVTKQFIKNWWEQFARQIKLDSEVKNSVEQKVINELFDFGFNEDEFTSTRLTFVTDTAFQIIKQHDSNN